MKKVLCNIAIALFALVMLMPIKADAATAYPKVVVESYSIENTRVDYGKEMTLTLVIANKNTNKEVTDILITYASDKKSVYPAMGQSNQIYVNSIGAGKSVEVEVPIIILDNQTGYADMQFAIQFAHTSPETGLYEQQSCSAMIYFPVNTQGNLYISNLSLPRTTVSGELGRISANYANTGTQDVFNATMQIKDENGLVLNSYILGTVAAGQSGYVENYLQAGQKGTMNLTVNFTYEDEKGNRFETQETAFSIDVTEAVGVSTGVDATTGTSANQNSSMDVSTIFLVVGVVLLVICLILIVRKKKD